MVDLLLSAECEFEKELSKGVSGEVFLRLRDVEVGYSLGEKVSNMLLKICYYDLGSYVDVRDIVSDLESRGERFCPDFETCLEFLLSNQNSEKKVFFFRLLALKCLRRCLENCSKLGKLSFQLLCFEKLFPIMDTWIKKEFDLNIYKDIYEYPEKEEKEEEEQEEIRLIISLILAPSGIKPLSNGFEDSFLKFAKFHRKKTNSTPPPSILTKFKATFSQTKILQSSADTIFEALQSYKFETPQMLSFALDWIAPSLQIRTLFLLRQGSSLQVRGLESSSDIVEKLFFDCLLMGEDTSPSESSEKDRLEGLKVCLEMHPSFFKNQLSVIFSRSESLLGELCYSDLIAAVLIKMAKLNWGVLFLSELREKIVHSNQPLSSATVEGLSKPVRLEIDSELSCDFLRSVLKLCRAHIKVGGSSDAEILKVVWNWMVLARNLDTHIVEKKILNYVENKIKSDSIYYSLIIIYLTRVCGKNSSDLTLYKHQFSKQHYDEFTCLALHLLYDGKVDENLLKSLIKRSTKITKKTIEQSHNNFVIQNLGILTESVPHLLIPNSLPFLLKILPLTLFSLNLFKPHILTHLDSLFEAHNWRTGLEAISKIPSRWWEPNEAARVSVKMRGCFCIVEYTVDCLKALNRMRAKIHLTDLEVKFVFEYFEVNNDEEVENAFLNILEPDCLLQLCEKYEKSERFKNHFVLDYIAQYRNISSEQHLLSCDNNNYNNNNKNINNDNKNINNDNKNINNNSDNQESNELIESLMKKLENVRSLTKTRSKKMLLIQTLNDWQPQNIRAYNNNNKTILNLVSQTLIETQQSLPYLDDLAAPVLKSSGLANDDQCIKAAVKNLPVSLLSELLGHLSGGGLNGLLIVYNMAVGSCRSQIFRAVDDKKFLSAINNLITINSKNLGTPIVAGCLGHITTQTLILSMKRKNPKNLRQIAKSALNLAHSFLDFLLKTLTNKEKQTETLASSEGSLFFKILLLHPSLIAMYALYKEARSEKRWLCSRNVSFNLLIRKMVLSLRFCSCASLVLFGLEHLARVARNLDKSNWSFMLDLFQLLGSYQSSIRLDIQGNTQKWYKCKTHTEKLIKTFGIKSSPRTLRALFLHLSPNDQTLFKRFFPHL